jgi:uncharacterized protein YyaL (SSP411 family)
MTGGYNRLGAETSPYLLQHKDNPVHWWPWSTVALKEAQAQNKPILLSVGYAACHWCHVMAHESFDDPQTADLMNRFFINIKLDREERPDLDALYQHALQTLGEQGGWPLTLFLTPAGEPFWGGTYFPPEGRHGRPGFRDALWQIARLWKNDSAQILSTAKNLRETLGALGTSRPGRPTVAPDKITEVAETLVRVVDGDHGGIGPAPKFPNVPVFLLFWRAWRRTGNRLFAAATRLTLDRMSRGGIYDHLGGGYARYTVDRTWLTPHFEKMLSDNAQILELLTHVWADTQNPLYADRARGTVGWLLREMRLEGGAFASALDADSGGEEGLYYTWTKAEVGTLLGPDAARFCQAYGVTAEGNFDGRAILNRLHISVEDADDEAQLVPLRATLLKARNERERPTRDDKVLADMNGLVIKALAHAGAAFGEPAWLAAAEEAFAFVTTQMTDGDRLWHTWCAGKARHPGLLDDYANMAAAALALFEATGDPEKLLWSQRWVATVDTHFSQPKFNGYYQSAADVKDVLVRLKSAADGAVPTGNATLVDVFARLAALTGSPLWRNKADDQVAAFSGELDRNIFPYATFLNGAEQVQATTYVVVVGPAEARRALVQAAFAAPCPTRVVHPLDDGHDLPPLHPAYGKGLVDGQAAAYVCVGQTCSAPVTTPEALRARLSKTGA